MLLDHFDENVCASPISAATIWKSRFSFTLKSVRNFRYGYGYINLFSLFGLVWWFKDLSAVCVCVCYTQFVICCCLCRCRYCCGYFCGWYLSPLHTRYFEYIYTYTFSIFWCIYTIYVSSVWVCLPVYVHLYMKIHSPYLKQNRKLVSYRITLVFVRIARSAHRTTGRQQATVQ